MAGWRSLALWTRATRTPSVMCSMRSTALLRRSMCTSRRSLRRSRRGSSATPNVAARCVPALNGSAQWAPQDRPLQLDELWPASGSGQPQVSRNPAQPSRVRSSTRFAMRFMPPAGTSAKPFARTADAVHSHRTTSTGSRRADAADVKIRDVARAPCPPPLTEWDRVE